MTPTTTTRRGSSDFVGSLLILTAGELRPFREVMADHQREWMTAMSPALEALAVGEKPKPARIWLEGTKGSAKDTLLAAAVFWLLAAASRPLAIQIAASDEEQAGELLKVARVWLHNNPKLASRVEIQSSKLICKSTGSEAEILTSDVAGSHGARPDLLIANELSHVPVGKWEFIANLFDNASKVPRGLVIVATNAGRVGSEAWKWRELARKSPRWSFHQFAQPAPWLDPEELEDARTRNPHSRFRRLFWGEWATGSDVLNDGVIEAAYAGNVPTLHTGSSDYVFAGGLDLAVSKDFAALVIIGKHVKTSRLRIAKCWLWRPGPGRKIDQGEIEATLLECHRIYRPVIAVDPYQGEYLISRLQKQQVKIEGRAQTGKNLVEQCSLLIEQFNSQNIDIPHYPPLRKDLDGLTIEERSYGFRLVSDKGPNGHGDTASALAIGIAAVKDAKPKITFMVAGSSAADTRPDETFEEYLGRFGNPMSPVLRADLRKRYAASQPHENDGDDDPGEAIPLDSTRPLAAQLRGFIA